MRRANIYFKTQLAGVLSETDTGYRFEYLSEYLSNTEAKPVSLTLPLTDTPYESYVLFSMD